MFLTRGCTLAYVLWLLHHLPATANRNDVEELLQERFAQQQGSPECDPDDVLRMQALAKDMWHAWSQYLHCHDQSAFAQAGYALKAGQLTYDCRYSTMHGMPVTGGRGFRGLKPLWYNGVPP